MSVAAWLGVCSLFDPWGTARVMFTVGPFNVIVCVTMRLSGVLTYDSHNIHAVYQTISSHKFPVCQNSPYPDQSDTGKDWAVVFSGDKHWKWFVCPSPGWLVTFSNIFRLGSHWKSEWYNLVDDLTLNRPNGHMLNILIWRPARLF